MKTLTFRCKMRLEDTVVIETASSFSSQPYKCFSSVSMEMFSQKSPPIVFYMVNTNLHRKKKSHKNLPFTENQQNSNLWFLLVRRVTGTGSDLMFVYSHIFSGEFDESPSHYFLRV